MNTTTTKQNTNTNAAGHTPGPWSITDRLLNIAGRPGPGSDIGGRYVASVCDWSIRPSCYEAVNNTLREEAEANARLIAAAPELLDALQALLVASEVLDGQEAPPDSADVDFFLESAKQARAAIARATTP